MVLFRFRKLWFLGLGFRALGIGFQVWDLRQASYLSFEFQHRRARDLRPSETARPPPPPRKPFWNTRQCVGVAGISSISRGANDTPTHVLALHRWRGVSANAGNAPSEPSESPILQTNGCPRRSPSDSWQKVPTTLASILQEMVVLRNMHASSSDVSLVQIQNCSDTLVLGAHEHSKPH